MVDVSHADLVRQLHALGVPAGAVLIVHTAFSRIRPVVGGPPGFIHALVDALGPDGTLVMPSFADDDDHVFDPRTSPCRAMGVVADTFWRQPAVLRTDSPHAFAARGPHAAALTQPQPVDIPHGVDSPVGRALALDGYVLLAGVGHDGNTTLHLAEHLAGVSYRLPSAALVVRDGRPVRVEYGEPDHCCQGFAKMDAWLEAAGRQRRGPLGHGEGRLMRSRDLVDIAVARLRDEETVFLHPSGACAECDAARASLPPARTRR